MSKAMIELSAKPEELERLLREIINIVGNAETDVIEVADLKDYLENIDWGRMITLTLKSVT